MQIKEEIMIKAITSLPANFIFHMMSVSECGYHNAYGEKARKYHSAHDIEALQKRASLLTASGGQHCGALFNLCVSISAAFDLEEEMLRYFSAMRDLVINPDRNQNFVEYQDIYHTVFAPFGAKITPEAHADFCRSLSDVADDVAEIFRVFEMNYPIYRDHFWASTEAMVSERCREVNKILYQMNLQALWEKMLQTKYEHENFYVVLCNSIENGPQAIDISNTKDIFSASTSVDSLVALISHEFGIYLLIKILDGTEAFQDLSLYHQTEALAEFYNRKILNRNNKWKWDEGIIRTYEEIYMKNPSITPRELFLSQMKK